MPLNFACRHRYPSGFDIDLTFEVDRRFTALFGPSGSGKTSILSMIAGFLRPNAGTIRVSGRTLADTAADVWLPPEQRCVGIVCQDSLLFPHLTVEGNLRYGLRHRRRPRRAIEFSRVAEVLEIGPLLGRSAQSLSGGERQRVALGRAPLSSPEILLMDEPLASLDAPLRVKILTYLERVVAEWNLPTLYVTHAQAEVRRAAEWVVIIRSRPAGRRRSARRGTEPTWTAGLGRFRRSNQPVEARLDRSGSRASYGPAWRATAFLAARRGPCFFTRIRPVQPERRDSQPPGRCRPKRSQSSPRPGVQDHRCRPGPLRGNRRWPNPLGRVDSRSRRRARPATGPRSDLLDQGAQSQRRRLSALSPHAIEAGERQYVAALSRVAGQ